MSWRFMGTACVWDDQVRLPIDVIDTRTFGDYAMQVQPKEKRCDYCGTHQDAKRHNCSQCGAPLGKA